MTRQKTILEPNGQIVSRLVQTSYETSRPFGKCKFRPELQQLTNRKFMSKPQRLAFDKGEEIWV